MGFFVPPPEYVRPFNGRVIIVLTEQDGDDHHIHSAVAAPPGVDYAEALRRINVILNTAPDHSYEALAAAGYDRVYSYDRVYIGVCDEGDC